MKLLDIDLQNGYIICSKCNIQKDLSNFNLCGRTKERNRYDRRCKECKKNNLKSNKYKNDIKNGFKICILCDIKKQLNQFPIKKLNGIIVKYNERCIDCKRQSEKIYSNNNHFKERRRNYYKNLRANNIDFVIKQLLRNRIRYALDGQKKANNTLNLLGIDLKEFKNYIELKFKEGMNWNNRGFGKEKWVIDHILPCELFDLSDSKQQRICFNYKNMQPKWFIDNSNKCDRLDDGRIARMLTKEEKLEYLRSKGFNL